LTIDFLKITIAIGGSFRPLVNLMECSLATLLQNSSNNSNVLSVFTNKELPASSPLRQSLTLKQGPQPEPKTKTKKSNGVTDKPLTFHTRIKSSGYGNMQPWSVTQQQKIKAKQSPVKYVLIMVHYNNLLDLLLQQVLRRNFLYIVRFHSTFSPSTCYQREYIVALYLDKRKDIVLEPNVSPQYCGLQQKHSSPIRSQYKIWNNNE
jgi:hypothetical protein